MIVKVQGTTPVNCLVSEDKYDRSVLFHLRQLDTGCSLVVTKTVPGWLVSSFSEVKEVSEPEKKIKKEPKAKLVKKGSGRATSRKT